MNTAPPPANNKPPTTKPPIINCHTHTFTSGHVPQFLAKTYLPWPFYFLVPLHPIVALFRAWLNGPDQWRFQTWYKTISRVLTKIKETLVRDWFLGLLYSISGLFVAIQVFNIVYGALTNVWPGGKNEHVDAVETILKKYHVQFDISHWYWQVLLVLALCIFFPSARNLLIFVFRNLYGFLKSLPGKNTKKLIQRYINLGRFAFHQDQLLNFDQLRAQYPLDTEFVVLPMDMKYMAAGKVPIDLATQMAGLKRIQTLRSDQVHPFVFVDSRRIAEDPTYFAWSIAANGDVRLEPCEIKTYIEDNGFCGFKIYPALGYFPFEPELLPLWKYAAQKNLPIMTHCTEGPIFYRGMKKPAWDKHPIFTDAGGNELFLPQIKNIDFVVNFTNPMNFLCLLHKPLLAKAVGQSPKRVQDLFGYEKTASPEPTETIKCDLSNLKICIGHFGGEDQWTRYFEMDRYSYTACVDKYPYKGIDFFCSQGENPASSAAAPTAAPATAPGKLMPPAPTPGKIEQVWKYVDWYSIICSMMIQYENVYADISFILHDPGILPLLRKTLNFPNTHLRKRVLYGTDFYVVRNYKSDREMLATLYAGLTEEEFDQIARYNPREFLNLPPL